MEDAQTGQVVAEAAEVDENLFVPALFGQWTQHVLELADVRAGHRVLDVGCGTGVPARTAVPRVGPTGSVTGVDPNPGMLAVARRSDPAIEWTDGAAERLPFEDASFDRVVSQFALMFFTDRAVGLGEMARVAKPGASVAVATWSGLETSPGYAALVDLIERLVGDEAAEALRAPFVLGTAEQVETVLSDHFVDVTVETLVGTARFDSIDMWVHADVRGWTLADTISDAQFDVLLAEARRELATFTNADGAVEFAAPALIGTAKTRS